MDLSFKNSDLRKLLSHEQTFDLSVKKKYFSL